MFTTLLAALTLTSQWPEPLGQWNTCYTPTRCASLDLFYSTAGAGYRGGDDEPYDPNLFAAMLSSPHIYAGASEGGFRITAWGFYRPGAPLPLDIFRPEDGWGYPTPAGWEDFAFAIGTPYWEAALGGEHWGAEGFLGSWDGDASFADLRFVWRGAAAEGGPTFDCIQAVAGQPDCLTVTPEPATVILLGSGLLALGVATLKRKRAA